MYSDGYIDQFGGGGNRKYKSLPFKKLLTDNSDLPMKKQLAALEEEHLAWKGSEQQVDDILVIGIRI
jgi:serine phosphatase RsbU (regulator of sigma subunit)